jgi:hypothetical protein
MVFRLNNPSVLVVARFFFRENCTTAYGAEAVNPALLAAVEERVIKLRSEAWIVSWVVYFIHQLHSSTAEPDPSGLCPGLEVRRSKGSFRCSPLSIE